MRVGTRYTIGRLSHPSFHLLLSSHSSSRIYLRCIACITCSFHVSLQVFLLFFALWGFQWNTFDGHRSSGILLNCAYQLYLLHSIVSKIFTDATPISLRIYSFLILSYPLLLLQYSQLPFCRFFFSHFFFYFNSI